MGLQLFLLGADLKLKADFLGSFPRLTFLGFQVNSGKMLFAQLMEFVLRTSFARIVVTYSGDAHAMTLP